MFKFLIGLFLTLVNISIICLSLFGIVPILSSIIGASPKDLGVGKYTIIDSEDARRKIGPSVTQALPDTTVAESWKLEGNKKASFSLTSQELTSAANYHPWSYFPFKDVQVRINPDNTVESSGIIIVKKINSFTTALQYSETQVKAALSKYNLPELELPYYIKAKGSASNNKILIVPETAKIGLIKLPNNVTAEIAQNITILLEDLIEKNRANFHINSLTFSGGNLEFDGEVPEKITTL